MYITTFDGNPKKGTTCGGTLIASKYVISAAHCWLEVGELGVSGKLDNNATKEDFTIYIGEHNIKKSKETFLEEKKIGVANMHHHPDFFGIGSDHPDLTLFELAEPVDLNVYTPACLARTTDKDKFVGRKGTIAGWGGLKNKPKKKDMPDVPYEVQLPIIECDSKVNYSLCAGKIKGKDGCNVSI